VEAVEEVPLEEVPEVPVEVAAVLVESVAAVSVVPVEEEVEESPFQVQVERRGHLLRLFPGRRR
jgi:hypothetical protein